MPFILKAAMALMLVGCLIEIVPTYLNIMNWVNDRIVTVLEKVGLSIMLVGFVSMLTIFAITK